MLRDDATTLLLQRLGNRGASEYQTIIESELRAVQTLLEDDATLLPWFLTVTNWVTASVTSNEVLALPDDFLQEVEEAPLQVYDPTVLKWKILEKDDYDALVTAYDDEPAGIPQKYALVGVEYRLFPTPDAIYPLRQIYFGRDTALNSNIENDWLKYASDLLLNRTGYQVASVHLQDTDLAMIFADATKVAKDRLWRMNESRMHVARNYMMGDN